MNCPDDNEEMVYVDSWNTEYFDLSLYQCPKCKTVKIDRSNRVYDD